VRIFLLIILLILVGCSEKSALPESIKVDKPLGCSILKDGIYQVINKSNPYYSCKVNVRVPEMFKYKCVIPVSPKDCKIKGYKLFHKSELKYLGDFSYE
jgi:hypothetical protein